MGLCKHEAAYSLQDEQEGQQIKEHDDSLQKDGEVDNLNLKVGIVRGNEVWLGEGDWS